MRLAKQSMVRLQYHFAFELDLGMQSMHSRLVRQIRGLHDGGFGTEFMTSTATEPTISAAETEVGISIPNSYRVFLLKFGTTFSADCVLSGIRDDEVTELGAWSVIGLAQRSEGRSFVARFPGAKK